ncbi:proteic killer suppression protein [Gracilibacillus orientalis]|uniref:Proteic killer suppression protein n=1 Tax=Gracilibacillus orientalis TaxID=334253 RepID=A0A1I4PM43_9BACI|nr:type II toxin-antitoxin system RelE/ParE family toxin [Gracilibacillus orientalis]SFM28520.1 proteic killer suppression protein [Gracilibacillus orientalis]
MNILYSSRKLEKILNNPRLIKKQYNKLYDKLSIRLSELRAANSLEDISCDPPPRRHKLKGTFSDCWGINVSKNYRIIIQPHGEYNENDLKTINEILIKDIEDYH